MSAQVTPEATSTPEVTVVIVAFRSRNDVLACLASLEAHAGLPYEAIVVDDASGDGTPEAVRETFPGVRVIAKEHNEGLSSGRNAALPFVGGRLVLMLDSDTTVKPGAIPAMAEVLDRRPETGLVGPRMEFPSGELQLSCRRFPPFLIPVMRRGPYAKRHPDPPLHRWHMMMDFDHATERSVAWVLGAGQMWRSDLPGRIGRYDEAVSSYGGEDIDWCLRVWAAGLEVRYAPQAEVVHHYQNVTHRSSFGRKSWRSMRDWYYLQWKHRRLRKDGRMAKANA